MAVETLCRELNFLSNRGTSLSVVEGCPLSDFLQYLADQNVDRLLVEVEHPREIEAARYTGTGRHRFYTDGQIAEFGFRELPGGNSYDAETRLTKASYYAWQSTFGHLLAYNIRTILTAKELRQKGSNVPVVKRLLAEERVSSIKRWKRTPEIMQLQGNLPDVLQVTNSQELNTGHNQDSNELNTLRAQEFSKQVIRKADAKGWTPAKLYGRLGAFGVTQEIADGVLRGEILPNAYQIHLFVKVLDVTFDDICPWASTNNRLKFVVKPSFTSRLHSALIRLDISPVTFLQSVLEQGLSRTTAMDLLMGNTGYPYHTTIDVCLKALNMEEKDFFKDSMTTEVRLPSN